MKDIYHLASKADTPVRIARIPSHMGIPGNEKADELANAARDRPDVGITISRTARQTCSEIAENLDEIQNRTLLESLPTNRKLAWLWEDGHFKPRTNITTALVTMIEPDGEGNWQKIQCQYCEDATLNPIHYLVECPMLEHL